jgi:hypothetical protein
MANDNNSVLTPKQWLKQNLMLTLREFWSSITAVFATKQQVASDIATIAEIAAPLHPVNINTLTPSSTFVANAIIGINGVIYRAKQATSHFPVVLETSGGALVVQVINGKKSFVVSDPTVHSDWEQWTDAAIEYWISQLAARATSLENADVALASRITALETALQSRPGSITYGGVEYSASDLLTAMASLMTKTVVTGE